MPSEYVPIGSYDYQDRTTKTLVLSGPTYAWTTPGNYVHRIRTANDYEAPWGAWRSATMWCGQGRRIESGHTGDSPPEGFKVCATCEARAVGAGQQSSVIAVAEGSDLIFMPRRTRKCPASGGTSGWANPETPTANPRIVQCLTCGQLVLVSYGNGYSTSERLQRHDLPATNERDDHA